MSEVTENEVEETAKAPAAPARMCKGTMPSLLVWFIRFHEEGSVSEIAKKYFTTAGKITDITKGNNQKYIVEQMKWSEEDIKESIATINENFVRGQAKEADLPGSVNARGLATSTIDDAEFSLHAIEKVATMMEAMEEDVEEASVTIADARKTYLEANPRKTKVEDAKAEDADADTDTEADAEDTEAVEVEEDEDASEVEVDEAEEDLT